MHVGRGGCVCVRRDRPGSLSAPRPPQPKQPTELHQDYHTEQFTSIKPSPAGELVELDGRRAGPVAHGPTSEASLLADTAKVVREQFIQR